MPWYVPVILRIGAAYIAGPLLLKPLVDQYAQTTLLLLQFLLCFAVALLAAVASHQLHLDWRIIAVGFGNGLAAYCYYHAITISLSRTALFAFWDDLLAMGLSYTLLHEQQFLNARIVVGIGLSVGAVILFTVHAHHQQATPAPPERLPKRLYLYAGAYSVLVGVGAVFMRYLGLQGTGLVPFLVNWYGGVVSAALLLCLRAADTAQAPVSLPRQAVPRLAGFSLTAFVGLSAAYGAYRLAPQTVVQPLFLVGEMIAPALIGLYVFGERQALDRQEKGYFVLGLAGGLLVALSFS